MKRRLIVSGVAVIAVAIVIALGAAAASGASATKRAKAERDTVHASLERTEALFTHQRDRADGLATELGSTKSQLADAQHDADIANATAKAAEGKALRDARSRLKDAQSALDVRTAQVSAREAAVRRAEGQLDADQFSGDGIYAVGTDIQPGTYFSAAPQSGNCYYAALRSPSTDLGSIITNNNSAGPTILSVSPGQYLEVSGCDPFVKR